MRSSHSVRGALAVVIAVMVVGIAPPTALALPNFGLLPTPFYPLGYIPHLLTGPAVDPPPLLPLPFLDPLPSPDMHHWQTEVSYGPGNPPGPIAFDVVLSTLTAGPFAFNVILPGLGSGVLFDVTYPDVPELGAWILSEFNGTPFSLALDSAVLEYPLPPPMPVPVIPGVLPPLPGPGAIVGPPVGGAMPVLTLTIVPEPAMLSLLAPLMIFAARRRRV